ncbi:MAG: TolC family protein [Marinicaulis sp.]|nr:TolC family protein [Marinicaulis sp.]
MAAKNHNNFLGICGAAFLAFQPAAVFAQDGLPGSLYPDDVVAPLKVAEAEQNTGKQKISVPAANTVPAQTDNPRLAKALGAASFILSGGASSTEFQSMIRRAVGRQPVLHAQASALDEMRAARRGAKSALYPQLSTQLRGDYVLSRDFSPTTDNVVESLRPREQFAASVTASQLLFDGGATFQRIKAAKARESEFKNSLHTRINQTAISALTTYHDLLTHQALAALGGAFIERHETILENVKERENLGAAATADVTRAVARLSAAQARLAEIRESERLSELRFEEYFENAPARLSRPQLEPDFSENRDQVVASSLSANPELAVASARATASTAEYKAAKGARLPEVRVSVDAVKYDVFDSGDDFDIRAGLNLNYNIFSGGARGATIAQAASRARQARFGEDQVRQEIEREAAIAYERVEGAKARLAALETAVIAHSETRDLVLERYRLARGDLIDVLQAENDYFEAGAAYLMGVANFDLANYALMQHTGELSARFSPQEEYADQIAGFAND